MQKTLEHKRDNSDKTAGNEEHWNEQQRRSLSDAKKSTGEETAKKQEIELDNKTEQRVQFRAKVPIQLPQPPQTISAPEEQEMPRDQQEAKQKRDWAQRQQRSAPMQSMPGQAAEGNAETSSDASENNEEEENEEPEAEEDEEQTKREFYKERIADQQAAERKIDAADAELSEESAEKEVEGEGDASGEAARAITGKVLQLAWEYLIPSIGLTIFYIDIHLFCRYFLHLKLFCAFGEEWTPGMKIGKIASMVKSVGEFAEIGLAIIINAVIFVIIFVIIPSLFNIIFGWL